MRSDSFGRDSGRNDKRIAVKRITSRVERQKAGIERRAPERRLPGSPNAALQSAQAERARELHDEWANRGRNRSGSWGKPEKLFFGTYTSSTDTGRTKNAQLTIFATAT